MKPQSKLILAAIFTIMLSSCANTKFTKQWIDEDFNEQPYDDILVLVVADKMGNREDAEDYIVKKLGEAGIDAMQSYDILPKTETIDREAVGKAIEGLHLDAVIVMFATGVTEEEYFIPTRRFGVYAGYGYGDAHYGSFYNYYPHAVNYVYIPGYDNTHYVVALETSLFDLKTGKLVWKIETQGLDRFRYQLHGIPVPDGIERIVFS